MRTPAGVDDRVAPRVGFRIGERTAPPVPADPRSMPIAGVALAVAAHAERAGLLPMLNLVGAWPPADRRLVALQVHFAYTHDEFPIWGAGRALAALLRDRAGFSRADLLWSFAMLEATERPYGPAFHLPARIAGELPDAALEGLEPVFQAALTKARQTITTQDERQPVAQLYGEVLERLSHRLPVYLLHDGDEIGPAVRAALGEALEAAGMRALLLHALSLTKPVPSRAWLRTAETRLAAALGGPSTVAAILEVFVRLDDHAHEDTDTLVRGLVWLLAFDSGSPATELLARVAVAAASAESRSSGLPFAARAAAAAVEALAVRPGDAPPRALARLVLSVRNKGLRARVLTALDRASADRGWAPGEAAELAVDDHGLGPAGVRSFPQSDGLVLEVMIDGDKPRLRASRHGKPLKGVPSGVDASEQRSLVKQLGQTLGLERSRVDALFAEGREWAWETWVARYLSHPVAAELGCASGIRSGPRPPRWRPGVTG